MSDCDPKNIATLVQGICIQIVYRVQNSILVATVKWRMTSMDPEPGWRYLKTSRTMRDINNTAKLTH